MTKISASVLAADILHLQDDVARILAAGADILHLDIMDGHFVPNLSYGPDLVAGLRRGFADAYLDVHLMMTHPEQYADAFMDAGASAVTVHAEIGEKAVALLQHIRARGLKAGISVKPGTDVRDCAALLPLVDLVLVMTVEPGFGGQKLMPEALQKVGQLREMGFEGIISVDGGVNADNAHLAVEQGADWLVMGTALFGAKDPAGLIRSVRA